MSIDFLLFFVSVRARTQYPFFAIIFYTTYTLWVREPSARTHMTLYTLLYEIYYTTRMAFNCYRFCLVFRFPAISSSLATIRALRNGITNFWHFANNNELALRIKMMCDELITFCSFTPFMREWCFFHFAAWLLAYCLCNSEKCGVFFKLLYAINWSEHFDEAGESVSDKWIALKTHSANKKCLFLFSQRNWRCDFHGHFTILNGK